MCRCDGVLFLLETSESSRLAWRHVAEKRGHGKRAGELCRGWVLFQTGCVTRATRRPITLRPHQESSVATPAFTVFSGERRGGCGKHPSVPGKRGGSFKVVNHPLLRSPTSREAEICWLERIELLFLRRFQARFTALMRTGGWTGRVKGSSPGTPRIPWQSKRCGDKHQVTASRG